MSPEERDIGTHRPIKLGNNKYVCTFPEPWKVMVGQLVVVKDKAALLQASATPAPQPPGAAHQHKP